MAAPKKILYVTTQITGTWRYFSWCSYPNIWYSRIQAAVIKLLGERSQAYSVKFYPNDFFKNPNVDTVLKDSKGTILKEALVDILMSNDYDLIITEAYATTLLEILCTQSQVLLFVPKDYVKLEKEALSALSKRVFLVESSHDYFTKLNELLDSNVSHKKIEDSFLFRYGLGSLECSPDKFAVKHLKTIIKESLL